MVIHDMLSWKPLEDLCGSIRTLGKSHPTTLPNASKHRDQDHEDESTAIPKSIEQDRKIVPFSKTAVTFMFHGTQIENIMQQGIQPGRTHTSRGRQHVHMARVHDIIYDDQESDAALTHVPKGSDALLILAFTQDNQYNIRITEERTALSEHTIDPCSSIAAFDTDGQPLLSSYWIMKKNLVTFQPRGNAGVLLSECSDASSDLRKVTLIRTTILPHPTA